MLIEIKFLQKLLFSGCYQIIKESRFSGLIIRELYSNSNTALISSCK
jgi:hypothetical protein